MLLFSVHFFFFCVAWTFSFSWIDLDSFAKRTKYPMNKNLDEIQWQSDETQKIYIYAHREHSKIYRTSHWKSFKSIFFICQHFATTTTTTMKELKKKLSFYPLFPSQFFFWSPFYFTEFDLHFFWEHHLTLQKKKRKKKWIGMLMKSHQWQYRRVRMTGAFKWNESNSQKRVQNIKMRRHRQINSIHLFFFFFLSVKLFFLYG